MIDPEAIEQAWRGPWQKLPRSYRRFYVVMAVGIGLSFWMFLPLALLGAVFDEPNRSEALGTAAPLFAAGLVSMGVAVFMHRMWAPEHAAQDALKHRGPKVAATLLRKRHVPAHGNIPLCSYYLFGGEAPGGAPVFARLTAGNGIALGTPATIAYDPARPGEGVVVESAPELRRR